MARAPFNQAELAPWAESLFRRTNGRALFQSSADHSHQQCNDLGQHYGGPVVVVVDANTYSSGDLFTAGIVDNRIGPVLCIGQRPVQAAPMSGTATTCASPEAAGQPCRSSPKASNSQWPCAAPSDGDAEGR